MRTAHRRPLRLGPVTQTHNALLNMPDETTGGATIHQINDNWRTIDAHDHSDLSDPFSLFPPIWRRSHATQLEDYVGGALVGTVTSTGYSFAGRATAGAGVRATGQLTGGVGAGAELHLVGGIAYFLGYDRTAGAYVPTVLDGATLSLRAGGVEGFGMAADRSLTGPGPLDLAGLITSHGSGGGFRAVSRTTGAAWLAYNPDGSWRLFNDADRVIVDANAAGVHAKNATLGTDAGGAVMGDAGFGAGNAAFGHASAFSTAGYALMQGSDGATYVNAASGKRIYFRRANADVAYYDVNGRLVGALTGRSAGVAPAGALLWGDGTDGYLESVAGYLHLRSPGGAIDVDDGSILRLHASRLSFTPSSGLLWTNSHLVYPLTTDPTLLLYKYNAAGSFMVRRVSDTTVAFSGLTDLLTLDNSGNLAATSYANFSDGRLKERVRDLSEPGTLGRLLRLRPRRFRWRANLELDEGEQTGLVAQEVEELFPDAVVTDVRTFDGEERETKALRYDRLVVRVVAGLRELVAALDECRAKVDLPPVAA